MEGDGRGSQDRRMSGAPSMPRSGPGMSDSDLGRLNVSLGMLDAGSLLAAQALHGAIQAVRCRRPAGIDPHLRRPQPVICHADGLPSACNLCSSQLW